MAAAVVKIKNTNTSNSYISIIANSMPVDVNNYLYSSGSNSISLNNSNLKSGDSIVTYVYSGSSWKDFLLVNTSKDNDLSVSLKVVFVQNNLPA